MSLRHQDDAGNQLAAIAFQLVGDCIVAALRRPDVVEAVRQSFALHESAQLRRMTKRDYAKREGVSVATVGRWITDGMPVIRSAKKGGAVRIEPIEADAWRKASVPTGQRTKSEPEHDRIDIRSVVRAAGLRAIGGAR